MERIPSPIERVSDLAWLLENLHILFLAARERFEAVGRGCIIIDCTVAVDDGNPFGFAPQAETPPGEPGLERMVREYEPTTQMVVHLLKIGGDTSTYRVGSVARR